MDSDSSFEPEESIVHSKDSNSNSIRSVVDSYASDSHKDYSTSGSMDPIPVLDKTDNSDDDDFPVGSLKPRRVKLLNDSLSSLEADPNDNVASCSTRNNSYAPQNDGSPHSEESIIEASSPEASKSEATLFRTPRPSSQIIISDSSDSEHDNLTDIVDDNIVKEKPKNKTVLASPVVTRRPVTVKEYKSQVQKVQDLEEKYKLAQMTLKRVNLTSLPDKGELLLKKDALLAETLAKARTVLNEMQPPTEIPTVKEATWDNIRDGINAVQPKTFGKQAMATYNAQKALTVEMLDTLHKTLKSCPTNDYLENKPKDINIELMNHQKQALAWLLWREKQKPVGGILADDMGLGKTLTMISLILKTKELKENHQQSDSEEDEYGDSKHSLKGGTLVICPASLLNQWEGEVKKYCKRGSLSVELFHGPNRESSSKSLAKYDMVITTYTVVLYENIKNGVLFRMKWSRIICDEAHQIRNHKSKTSVAICSLRATCRWALTGTPIQNKELDMYGLLKFLRCSPFDDYQVWKRWIADRSSGGMDRLHTVISSILLRRTKQELIDESKSFSLPERKWELIPVILKKDELNVYQKILVFSSTLFAQFLHQRAEKNQDYLNSQVNAPTAPNGEYFKMREKLIKLNRCKEVSQHEILVLLLRLRQVCCHPHLIQHKLQSDDATDLNGEDDGFEELNLLEQLNRLDINKDDSLENGNVAEGLASNQGETVGLQEAFKGFLNPSNLVFAQEHLSSKFENALKVLKSVIDRNDKAVVVSQFKSLLDLFAFHLKNENLKYLVINGNIPVNKRMPIIDSFNDPNDKHKILLLSLTAGGVGLNLIGGNHLLILDLHWNPQLEKQAQDRIYRVGQKKPVYIYKFMASNTIEERINDLQQKKLDLANNLLSGSKEVQSAKLTINDLRMIFNM